MIPADTQGVTSQSMAPVILMVQVMGTEEKLVTGKFNPEKVS